MDTRDKVDGILQKQGYQDFKWINPADILVSQWVRMKCMYGCNEYGQTATCPPNVPAIEECERFFREYSLAVIIHFEKEMEKPEDRFAWTRKINLKLLGLEKEIFCSGFEKAFLLFMDSCNICKECRERKEDCVEPKMSRPTPEALGMDVYSTVRNAGYPIQVLSDYAQKMNRYAFLLIE
jgi:predicted metal-binding protein